MSAPSLDPTLLKTAEAAEHCRLSPYYLEKLGSVAGKGSGKVYGYHKLHDDLRDHGETCFVMCGGPVK